MISQRGNFLEMDDFKNIAPKLSEVKRENPFSVPQNYFDDFNSRLYAKIEAGETVKKPKVYIRYLRPIIGIAAGLALIITLVYGPINRTKNGQTADIGLYSSDSSSESDLLSMIGNIDDNSLLAIMENNQKDEPIGKEEIVDYLSSNMSSYEIYLNLTE
jgi:hypothetical protein